VPPSILRFRPGVTLPRRAYLDTNLFLHARDQESRKYWSARACLRALTAQNVELNVSALVFDELWWAQFRASYRLLTGHELTGREYKHHVAVWRDNWPVMRRITTELLAWERLKFVDATSGKDQTHSTLLSCCVTVSPRWLRQTGTSQQSGSLPVATSRS
jgi:hypothetical protein